ncbi:serine hydrolase domain-containing protein [Sphingomonas sp.]|uniref:serine hydrolase domain-containing protein n=1 Tax=Sphingomonas sp. TaxID=28214 RepID=UPI003B3A144E
MSKPAQAAGWLVAAALLTAAPLGAQPVPAAVPQATEEALDSDRRQRIDTYVAAEMARQRIPGLTLGIYRHGVPLYLKGYGLADIEWRVPAGADTRMQTGSLGKQFVAAAILRLAEEGKLDIDASVTRYFPEAPPSWRAITLANFLSHTSGIGTYDTDARTRPGGLFDYRRDFTEDQLAAAIVKLPAEFRPGTQWSYNNTNYVLLGILIHRVTGKNYGDYLHDTFFAPLGMRDTRVISDTDIVERRASGYEMKGGVLNNQAWVSATFNSTADGTIYTTVEDMARWDRALYGDAILKPASRARMWTPFGLADGKANGAGYGFAWFIDATNGHRRIAHSGAWQGFTSDLTRFPDDGLSVAVFVNLDSEHARPDHIAHVVAGLVSPALMPPPATALPDDPARAARLRALLERASTGASIAADFDAGAPRPTPLLARDLAAALPAGWRDAPMTLVQRDDHRGGVRYGYRVGPAGDTRLLVATLLPSGRLMDLSVLPDPDSR